MAWEIVMVFGLIVAIALGVVGVLFLWRLWTYLERK